MENSFLNSLVSLRCFLDICITFFHFLSQILSSLLHLSRTFIHFPPQILNFLLQIPSTFLYLLFQTSIYCLCLLSQNLLHLLQLLLNPMYCTVNPPFPRQIFFFLICKVYKPVTHSFNPVYFFQARSQGRHKDFQFEEHFCPAQAFANCACGLDVFVGVAHVGNEDVGE